MKKSATILALASLCFMAACAKSDRDVIADACVSDDPENEPYCSCLADAMEENLSPTVMSKLADGIRDGESREDAEDALTLPEKAQLLNIFPHTIACVSEE